MLYKHRSNTKINTKSLLLTVVPNIVYGKVKSKVIKKATTKFNFQRVKQRNACSLELHFIPTIVIKFLHDLTYYGICI